MILICWYEYEYWNVHECNDWIKFNIIRRRFSQLMNYDLLKRFASFCSRNLFSEISISVTPCYLRFSTVRWMNLPWRKFFWGLLHCILWISRDDSCLRHDGNRRHRYIDHNDDWCKWFSFMCSEDSFKCCHAKLPMNKMLFHVQKWPLFAEKQSLPTFVILKKTFLLWIERTFIINGQRAFFSLPLASISRWLSRFSLCTSIGLLSFRSRDGQLRLFSFKSTGVKDGRWDERWSYDVAYEWGWWRPVVAMMVATELYLSSFVARGVNSGVAHLCFDHFHAHVGFAIVCLQILNGFFQCESLP